MPKRKSQPVPDPDLTLEDVLVPAPSFSGTRQPLKSATNPKWAVEAPYLVAFGNGTNVCPIWGDKLPYKSITIVVDAADQDDAESCCAYVHGGDCVEKTRVLPDGRVAIRSNYMCW
jgi:hypothetical protein